MSRKTASQACDHEWRIEVVGKGNGTEMEVCKKCRLTRLPGSTSAVPYRAGHYSARSSLPNREHPAVVVRPDGLRIDFYTRNRHTSLMAADQDKEEPIVALREEVIAAAKDFAWEVLPRGRDEGDRYLAKRDRLRKALSAL